jgi:drug/metabolite transporter (DMT)-like permease
LKILTAAIFTRILLNRHLNVIQWFGLALLCVGILLVEIEQLTLKKQQKDVKPVMGFIAVVISCKFRLI